MAMQPGYHQRQQAKVELEALNTQNAQLRQENAALRAENERLQAAKDALIMQAQIWAGEAKTQRATVDEVGALLGGIPDWGPIAAKVEEALAERDSLRADLDEAREVFTLMKFMSDQIALIRHDWLEKVFSTDFVITHKKLVHKLESVKKK